MKKLTLPLLIGTLLLGACQSTTENVDTNAMTQAIEARSDEDRARDQFRHPAQTLAFFKVAPGMKVAEALPGTGWYSKVLGPYLGAEGTLIGLNYNDTMWDLFGFLAPEFIAERIESTHTFGDMVKGFSEKSPEARGYTFATTPDSLNGSLDRVLFIRALHNLNRFEDKAGTRTQALAVAHRILKPDGLLGVVQHRVPESAKNTEGNRGYMKESEVIKMIEAAGFKLVASSEINANLKDKPMDNEIVWRLPPTFAGSRDDEEKKAAAKAIGESDRMTLLFKKK